MQSDNGPIRDSETSLNEARRVLGTLLRDERLAMLSTQNDGAPYASLVAFVASEDLRTILFATPRATRKFANIEADGRVAMLVHNAHASPVDFADAAAATATGLARELRGSERATAGERFARVHPHLREFVESPSTALLRIDVASYFIVRRFQHVTELHLHQSC